MQGTNASKKKGITVNLIRRLVQFGAIILLAAPLFILPEIWMGNYLASHLFTFKLSDPLAVLETIFATHFSDPTLALTALVSAVPLALLAVALGRVFCGWICPVHTLLEWGHTLFKRWPSSKKPVKKSTLLPTCILLASLVGSWWIAIPLFTTFSSIGVLARVFYFGIGLELLLLLIVVALEFYQPMFWCRRLCPVGILYGWLGTGKVVEVSLKDDLCNDCGICRTKCSMHVDPGKAGLYNTAACMTCGKCVSVCPHQALRFRPRPSWFGFKKNFKRKDVDHGVPTQP